MFSFRIRQYQLSDRDGCRSLWRELTEWHQKIYNDKTIGGEHPEDYFDKYLANVKPSRLWVAIDDSRIVGLVGLIVKEGEAEMEPLVVSKGYRHKGIGTQLIKTVLEEAKSLGVKSFSVKPVARNIDTINFLYDQGFKNIGQIELFISFSNYKWKPGPDLFGHKFNF